MDKTEKKMLGKNQVRGRTINTFIIQNHTYLSVEKLSVVNLNKMCHTILKCAENMKTYLHF